MKAIRALLLLMMGTLFVLPVQAQKKLAGCRKTLASVHQSVRSAIIGSTLVARRAGK